MLVLNNFMENLLGLLSDMDKAEVRIPIKLYTWNIHGCRIKYSLNTYLIFAGPMTVESRFQRELLKIKSKCGSDNEFSEINYQKYF